MGRKRKKSIDLKQIVYGIIVIILFIGIEYSINTFLGNNDEFFNVVENYNNISDVPEYNGQVYVELNNNVPFFEEKDYTTKEFEKYSQLDRYGRCGVAFANICKEIMPPEGDKRGDIGNVKPTGWKQKKYDGEYLYNRCHLIGYQLSDEDDNELNLITGTRYFNVSGMLPFENKVADYINESNKNMHVLYRVTPDFKDNNLVANGVEIEAYSVEDSGDGICFNVYIYNVQPNINIDYKTGESFYIKN